MPQTVKQDNRYHGFGVKSIRYIVEKYGGFGIKSGTDLEKAMKNDFYTLETNEDTSDIVFGDTESDLTFNDMKGASFDDDGWDELIAKIPVSEILDFMANAFHNIQAIPSIGFNGYAADDGPGGSDSHTLGEGAYRGQPYEDAEEYTGYGARRALVSVCGGPNMRPCRRFCTGAFFSCRTGRGLSESAFKEQKYIRKSVFPVDFCSDKV